MATGITWGAGTLILLFYNGVILGAVAADYIAGGQGVFLAGWLLPHGSIEIPAILLGGQAGFILAGALIGWGENSTACAEVSGCAGSFRDRGRRGRNARLGRTHGSLHLAIPPTGASIRVEDLHGNSVSCCCCWRRSSDGRAGNEQTPDPRRSRLKRLRGVTFSFELATPVTRSLAWAVDTAASLALAYGAARRL